MDHRTLVQFLKHPQTGDFRRAAVDWPIGSPNSSLESKMIELDEHLVLVCSKPSRYAAPTQSLENINIVLVSKKLVRGAPLNVIR